jgi:hypothetical protein
VSADGPGRRLTDDQQEQAAQLFAGGASDRQVAEALDVGNGTANRLRHRLAARIAELTGRAPADGHEAQEAAVGDQDGTAEDGVRDAVDDVMRGGLLEQLGEKRDELIGQLTDLQGRADASRSALSALLAERLRILGEGGDAAQLRDRLDSARHDLDDWETSAGLVLQQIAIADQRIGEVQAEQQLAELRALLVPAVAERDAAIGATGGRMAAAVLAVKAAAEEFTAAMADETAARDRAELLAAQVASLAGSLGEPVPDLPGEPESTVLAVRGGDIHGPELELVRAMGAAQLGRAELVAKHLAEAFGWLPMSREDAAAEAEQWREKRAEMDRVMLAPQPAQQPWTRPDTASVGVDRDGREVGYPGYRPPAPPHPLDGYWGIHRG